MPADHPHDFPWIRTYTNHAYFFTESGESWTPVGQNDAIAWPELKGLFLNRDPQAADEYFRMLSAHGITCMRLMLEYCQAQHRYVENPAGRFVPNMVALWDALFTLARKYDIRFLLTPFDTFWMRRRWKFHPYNLKNGGLCSSKSQWLISKEMRAAIKNRLSFFTERWGATGAIFAWDLWNEIHPAHARNEVEQLSDYINDIGGFLKNREIELYGKHHLQTVSFYGTSLLKDHRMASLAFRHPGLDFATIHLYDEPRIDRPRNTVDAALVTAGFVKDIISEINDNRPFFDSEHGPIYTFNNRHRTLDESFDDEYFANMQWAHLASGGAGGGMRWPYRHPHVLTAGMRRAQQSLAQFAALVNWKTFIRTSLNDQITTSNDNIVLFSCGDDRQAIVWLLKKKHGDLSETVVQLHFPQSEKYDILFWDTLQGRSLYELPFDNERSVPVPPFGKNTVLYIRKRSAG